MKFSTRLVTYGYWGTLSPPPFTFNITSTAALKLAKKRPGALQNLRILRADQDDSHAITLDYSLVFPASFNAKTLWANVLGGTDYLAEYLGAFGGTTNVLCHENAQGPGYYRASDTSIFIPESTGHAHRFFLSKPPKSGALALWSYRWDAWQITVVNGKAFFMQCTPDWTQAKESQFYILLGSENPTDEQQESLDDLKKEIYAVYESIEASNGGGGWYGKAFTIAFLPEHRGALEIAIGEGTDSKPQTVELPDLVKARLARTPQPLWQNSAPEIYSTRGSYFWQEGYPKHALSGALLNPEFKTGYYSDSLNDLITSMSADSGDNLPALDGTAITASCEAVNDVWNQIVARFTTSNPRRTPYLYGVSAYLEPGGRSGIPDVSFDSNDCGDPLSGGVGPILDIEPQLEGDMRRSQYVVTMRDISGATIGNQLIKLGKYVPALENHVADLSIGGVRVITEGLVKNATLDGMASATENLSRFHNTTPYTTVQNLVCDGWAILDEIILEGDAVLVGDGANVGRLFDRALRFAGFKNSRINISQTAGKFIRQAAFGETWVCANSKGCSLGDFMRDVAKKHGRGAFPYQDGATGIWYFGARSTSIALVQGHAANFTSDSSLHDADSYPGRFAAFELQSIRDTSDFYNWIRVEGGEDENGLPLVWEEPIWQSIGSGEFGQNSHTFIGRKREHLITDAGCRTIDECEDIGRSVMEFHSLPPRFHSFNSYYHRGLFPGMLITLDAIPCRIARIGGGSTARDEMSIDAQEVTW